MSKKNSNAILRNGFEKFNDVSSLYLRFKKKLNNFKYNSYLIAVSGGPDSLALSALAKAYEYETKVKFSYVLVNHNIRKNSIREAKEVKKLLNNYDIKIEILTNKKKIQNNIQSQARVVRYDLLSSYCLKKGLKTILTAHNLEDQVETFFIRLSRGSGLTGLSSMSPLINLKKNIKLYRPLLDTPKKLLKKTSKLTFGRYFKDPSNYNSKYLRTKIRSLKKPLNQSGIDYSQIIKSINNLASSKATLEKYFFEISKDIIKKKTSQEVIIDLKKFYELNQEFKIKVLNQSLKTISQKYYSPRSKKVINLIKNLSKKNSTKFTLSGCLIFKKERNLYIKKEKRVIS